MAEETKDDEALWAEWMTAELRAMTTEAVSLMRIKKPEPDDAMGWQRRMRTLVITAQAVKAIKALRDNDVRRRGRKQEDEVREVFDDGLDAESTEQLRQRLWARVLELRVLAGRSVETGDAGSPQIAAGEPDAVQAA